MGLIDEKTINQKKEEKQKQEKYDKRRKQSTKEKRDKERFKKSKIRQEKYKYFINDLKDKWLSWYELHKEASKMTVSNTV